MMRNERCYQMSYYYNYYIGYKKDGKIYPWGPYTANHELMPAICRSASFASDLHEDFYNMGDDLISAELREAFSYDDGYGGKEYERVRYLPVKELPKGSYIRRGYFLISDVEAYEKEDDHTWFDGFYKHLTPQVYAAKLENQLKFGPNKPKKNEYGEFYTEPNASDYMYYAYPDYESKEYECSILRRFVGVLEDYDLGDGVEYVILETEG